MKIKKGDKIRVIVGKDKGKEGVVEKVYNKSNKILVLGINLYKRHLKKSDKFPQGGVIDVPRPILVSKVMFICPKCKKPTKIGYQIEKNRKVRICKKCKSII